MGITGRQTIYQQNQTCNGEEYTEDIDLDVQVCPFAGKICFGDTG